MKRCVQCVEKRYCLKICDEVERRLPSENAGRNSCEICMSPESIEIASERLSLSGWERFERAVEGIALDLSILTVKEKKALMLIVMGLSEREAAKRLKISRASLRTRISAARRKLIPARNVYLIEEENNGIGQNNEGCANG
jgi:DNA-binding CsgD family transcriptional regulator